MSSLCDWKDMAVILPSTADPIMVGIPGTIVGLAWPIFYISKDAFSSPICFISEVSSGNFMFAPLTSLYSLPAQIQYFHVLY
jgi:hypothetical protein